MKTPNLIALAASLLLNLAGLVALAPRAASFAAELPAGPVAEIDGLRVIDLAPVHVVPDAEERHRAEVAEAPWSRLVRVTGERALSYGSRLTMPYYSFGTAFGRISKD